jgi:hypothetical protein
MPDLHTFGKLCRWLEVNPASVLEVPPQPPSAIQLNSAAAHLKANREIDPDTAKALAKAIVRAQHLLGEVSG